MQLPQYMSENFPGLQLTPPLFYSWPIALRFELNSEQAPQLHRDAAGGPLKPGWPIHDAHFAA